jgi:hypothetical protein
MEISVQVIGSLLILAPFVLVQLGRLATTGYPFLVLNTIGSAVLAIDATLGQQWGFLLLEGVWAVVSMIGIVRRLSGKPAARPTH